MTEAIEKEFKALISEDDYIKLCGLIDLTEQISQTNYYFDTHDFFLYKSGGYVRIREKQG